MGVRRVATLKDDLAVKLLATMLPGTSSSEMCYLELSLGC